LLLNLPRRGMPRESAFRRNQHHLITQKQKHGQKEIPLKSSVTAKTGRYYHVVAIYDKENEMCRVYVDGQPAGEVAAAGSFGFPPKTEAHWFGIGGDAHPSGAAQFCLTGEIVVARMYDHALSRDEAYRLYEKAEQSKQAAE
ncbi:MAG: LamG-like jellyroll fold domain-containing protein, partial [Alloprevotella sp.]|nr:LamG-like jellyroll fold domain-containing protein [Alloprevotella sp.]